MKKLSTRHSFWPSLTALMFVTFGTFPSYADDAKVNTENPNANTPETIEFLGKAPNANVYRVGRGTTNDHLRFQTRDGKTMEGETIDQTLAGFEGFKAIAPLYLYVKDHDVSGDHESDSGYQYRFNACAQFAKINEVAWIELEATQNYSKSYSVEFVMEKLASQVLDTKSSRSSREQAWINLMGIASANFNPLEKDEFERFKRDPDGSLEKQSFQYLTFMRAISQYNSVRKTKPKFAEQPQGNASTAIDRLNDKGIQFVIDLYANSENDALMKISKAYKVAYRA